MYIEREQVIDLLRSQGEHDKAHQADCALPRQVDTEQDSGLLHAFDINTTELLVVTQADDDGDGVSRQ